MSSSDSDSDLPRRVARRDVVSAVEKTGYYDAYLAAMKGKASNAVLSAFFSPLTLGIDAWMLYDRNLVGRIHAVLVILKILTLVILIIVLATTNPFTELNRYTAIAGALGGVWVATWVLNLFTASYAKGLEPDPTYSFGKFEKIKERYKKG